MMEASYQQQSIYGQLRDLIHNISVNYSFIFTALAYFKYDKDIMITMYKYFLSLIIFLYFSMNLYADTIKKEIIFAPLPISHKSSAIETFLPLFNHIETLSGIKTKFIYEKDYATIIEKFKQNKIDIMLVGPLPYIELNKVYKFNEPIIGFKQKNGEAHYRCVLAKFGKDQIDFNKQLKIALTQPLSTCGYYMTNILLKERYNLDLKNQKYKYTMSHENALLSVLGEDFQIAGVKDNIANEFATLGIRTIAKSSLIPGFSLVVNTKTLSKTQILIIQKLILSIPQSTYKTYSGIASNGFIKIDKTFYDNVHVDLNIIPIVGNTE